MSQLRVGSIATTAGTSVLSLNNGILTDPNKPAFHVYRPAAQTSAGVGAFDVAEINVGGHYSTSTYRFTAPVVGNYFFAVTALPQSNTSVIFFKLRKNSSEINYPSTYIINSNETISISRIISLNVNDYVDVYFFADGFESLYTSFSGYLIG